MVFDGEIRQTWRTLLTFTRPYFGTASSMSKTLAVSMYAGGSRSRAWMEVTPPLRSRLSWARCVRISFARARASMRCCSDLSGAATWGFVGGFTAGGTGGESTQPAGAINRQTTNSHQPLLEVESRLGGFTVFVGFAGQT